MNNNQNSGCGCGCNTKPESIDIQMDVCDRNINMLPMLQTYTTKVLQPNLEGCCKKNILTQEMLSCENYKYVIKWDFDLNGQTITVPENCILEFDGGSLKNGTITGQSTGVMSKTNGILGDDITLAGSWDIQSLDVAWFKTLNVANCNKLFQLTYVTRPTITCSGSIVTDTPIIITSPVILNCTDFTVHQTTWGYPAVVVDSFDVSILGTIKLYADVDTRVAVTNPYWDIVDKKASASGIVLGQPTQKAHGYSNLEIENLYVYNFIGGIVVLGGGRAGWNNLRIKYIYVENVDFGVFGAGYYNMSIDTVEFKDIASYVGSEDPSHAVYFTGGEGEVLSENIVINNLYGSGCISKNADSVLSVKSTEGFRLLNASVDNISGFSQVLFSAKVLIENCFITNAKNQIANVQVTGTKAMYKNIHAVVDHLREVEIEGTYLISNAAGSSIIMEDIDITVIEEDTIVHNCYIYIGTGEHVFRNIKVNGPSDSNVKVFGINAICNLEVYDITTNMYISHVVSPDDVPYSTGKIYVDPEHIDLSRYEANNDSEVERLRNIILPNRFVREVTTHYPFLVGCDKIKLVNGDIMRMYAVSNQVVMVFNDGNSWITNSDDVKLKAGVNYAPSEWTYIAFISLEPNKVIELYSDYTPAQQ